jgi:hypothetical protein
MLMHGANVPDRCCILVIASRPAVVSVGISRYSTGVVEMTRILAALAFGFVAFTAPVLAQETTAPPAKSVKAAGPKVSKDQKLCRYRFPTGKQETWVCQKDQPCCAWDAINYVKCGSTITGCL